MNRLSDNQVFVVGSGLVGSVLALRLIQRGFHVEVIESREDMRTHPMSAGRSINLALSHRGIVALERVGLANDILKHAVQMSGRMIHGLDGSLQLQPYSFRSGEHIHSISRRTLNVMLMSAFEKLGGKINFSTRLTNFDPSKRSFTFLDSTMKEQRKENIIVIASDGANSAARKSMLDHSASLRMNYAQKFQPYGFKELTIPPGVAGEFLMERNALHIWPRGHFMMIALPNPDATFTVTLFLPFKGPDSFENLTDPIQVELFFEKYFPDAIPLITDLKSEFFQNPTGHLNSVKCSPWHYQDQLLLMGDAAHAIIPFYGQGMNCGFEDVVVFDTLIDKMQGVEDLFAEFENQRKINADAISDLAEDNFEEMRDKVADPVFQRKRKLEGMLEEKYPDYYSKYAMVTFRPDISYYDAMVRGRRQDDFLISYCSNKLDFSSADLDDVFNSLQSL
ncbi:MAG: NAD(P)/FAD-dependent oxidoreductase [Saprospiraceae bacterium]